MNIQFLFKNGKDSVVDEYSRPKPMDYIVYEKQFRLEMLSSHTQYLARLPLKYEKEVEIMQMENQTKRHNDIIIRETLFKRNYTRYSDQDKVGLFELMFEKCLSASAISKQLGIYVCTAQKMGCVIQEKP